jgi:membrane fusion protein, heavy metal efflux system
MKNILFYITTATIITLASCHGNKEAKESNNDSLDFVVSLSKAEMTRMDIRTGMISKGVISIVIRGTGKIKITPNCDAIVSSCIPGKVTKIYALEGQTLKKGQPIFNFSSFELIELQQSYLVSKNDANFYKLEYDRQKELRTKNIGSLADFQSIESKYYTAISNKESLGEKLLLIGINPSRLEEEKENFITNSIDIASPIDGYLFKLSVTMGQRIEQNAELAKIVDLSSMYAEVNVFEKDVDLLNEGQEVFVDFVNESLEHQTGYIYNISRSIDPDTRSIKVYVRFKNLTSSKILPGMAIKTEIRGTRALSDKHFIIPVTGLLQEGELYYIFIVKGESSKDLTFKKTKVFLGENDGDHSEITLAEKTTDSINIVTQNVYLVNNELSKKDE